jgi:N-acetylglucosamine-6-phosphate deacetylase
MLHGRQISLHEKRLIDSDGTLARAHLTMIKAVRNAVNLLGLSLLMPLSWHRARRRHFSVLTQSLG